MQAPCFIGMIVRLTNPVLDNPKNKIKNNPVLEGTGFRPHSSLDRTCLRCSDHRLGHFGLGRGQCSGLGTSKQAEREGIFVL